jgi:HlyD family secretion protein
MRNIAGPAIAVSLLFSAAAHAQETAATTEPPPPPSISVMVASKKSIKEELVVTGSFAAGEEVLVSPEIEGMRVSEILAEEGDSVAQGQVLARLSDEQIQIELIENEASLARNKAAIANAENQIEQAQINLKRTKDDLNRTKKLRTSGVSTAEQFDQRQSAYDLGVSQLSAANVALDAAKADGLAIQAQRKVLEWRLARTSIAAPVAGFISRRAVQLGGIASATRDPMFRIAMDGEVKLVAEVPESDLPRVKLGLKASIALNGIEKPIAGEVKLISPEVNQQTRIGLAHIRIEKGVRVPLGSFGRATISLAAAEAVALPLTAVTFGEDGPTVQIVKEGKVEVRKVITGLVSTDDIEVTDGVQAGETFVARAGAFVREGDVVTPVVVDFIQ